MDASELEALWLEQERQAGLSTALQQRLLAVEQALAGERSLRMAWEQEQQRQGTAIAELQGLCLSAATAGPTPAVAGMPAMVASPTAQASGPGTAGAPSLPLPRGALPAAAGSALEPLQPAAAALLDGDLGGGRAAGMAIPAIEDLVSRQGT